ncbi:MAG: DUF4259 domain-containing protein [Corynebacteriales bacterium]|nr:DUF4259 domain-containing protein [Mycobacteriales bacterium]
MSAWDMGPFDNDSAEDLVLELADAPDIPAQLDASMQTILQHPGYLDCPLVERAIAAACLIGAKLGINGPLPEGVDELLNARPFVVTPELRVTAQRTFERALAPHNNEWCTVWEEDEQLEEAIAAIGPYRQPLAATQRMAA